MLDKSTISEMIDRAKAAAENAYAPYSKFDVGAVVLTNSGKFFSGCNIENMSFGATVCAERTAIFKAVSEGYADLIALCVYHAGGDMPYPCGICRQVLSEFSKHADIIVANDYGYEEFTLNELFPYRFEAEI